MFDRDVNVLLIEDNPGDARLIREALTEPRGAPFRLEVADRLSTGLECLANGGIDVVLLDLTLPGTQGLETLFRTRAKASGVPIVVLTILADETLAVKAVQEGAQDYLLKGHVDPHSLARSIRYAIERNRLQVTLRAAEARFRTIVTKMLDGIIVLDKAEVVRFVNPAAEALFGGRGALLGLKLREILGKSLDLPLMEGETREIDIVVNGVGERIVEMRAVEIEWEGGSSYLISLCDITERKRAQEMIMRSEKLAAIGRLTAGAAHEILNPATIIGMHAQELLTMDEDPATVRNSAEIIQRNVSRIAKICSELRRFSRKEESTVNQCDLGEVVRETVSMVEHQTRLENVTFSVDLPPEPLLVKADRDQMIQVFLNLISNARDAMPEGGAVTISAETFRRDGVPWVRTSVTDEGVGISKENLCRIFDPFFTTKEKDKGTGIGLSIVYGIVDDLGGRIDAQSEVGRGTMFCIELPAHRFAVSKGKGANL